MSKQGFSDKLSELIEISDNETNYDKARFHEQIVNRDKALCFEIHICHQTYP